MKPKVLVTFEIEGCDECIPFYLYTIEGSFCMHPSVTKKLNGKYGFISRDFIHKQFPKWCPYQYGNDTT